MHCYGASQIAGCGLAVCFQLFFRSRKAHCEIEKPGPCPLRQKRRARRIFRPALSHPGIAMLALETQMQFFHATRPCR